MSAPFWKGIAKALQAARSHPDRIAAARQRVDHANRKRATEHGDAAWLSLPHQLEAGLTVDANSATPVAPILGKIGRQWETRVYDIAGNFTNVYGGDRHGLTVAANGAGKSSAVVVPNLLIDKCSVIITDTKGELVEKTAAWREQKLGQRCHVLAPFGGVSVPACRLSRYNPLDLVRRSPTPEAIAMLFSHALVPEKPGQAHPFFDNSARQMLGGIIMFVCFSPDFYDHQRNLATVYKILIGSAALRTDVYEQMTKSSVRYVRSEGHKALDRLSRSNGDDVLATLWSNLDFFNSEEILDCLSSSDFDLKTFREDPQSLYLCLPGFLNEACAGWLRLILISVFTAVEMCGPAKPGPPALRLYLDEFNSFGSFWKMLEQYPRARGYGIQFWMFVQSFVQLEHNYKESWVTFFENAGFVQCFGGLSSVTADFISKHLGKKTTRTDSGSSGGSSWANISQPLMSVDQLGRMAAGEQILLYKGHQPVKSFIQPYYEADPGMDGWIRHNRLPASGRRSGKQLSARKRVIMCPCQRTEMNVPTDRGELNVKCPGCARRFTWSP